MAFRRAGRYRDISGHAAREDSAQASAVAPVGSSAARSNAAQILGGLVKQDMGVVGHGVSRHTIHHFTRANYQVQSAGWAQIPSMKWRWSLLHACWYHRSR